MKKLFTVILLALAICLSNAITATNANSSSTKTSLTASAPALSLAPAPDSILDFTLVNSTGYNIHQVYVSQANNNDWEEDVLGRDILADGEAVNIHFGRKERYPKWDLRVVWSDNYPDSIWYDLSLPEISKITLKYNRNSGETKAVLE